MERATLGPSVGVCLVEDCPAASARYAKRILCRASPMHAQEKVTIEKAERDRDGRERDAGEIEDADKADARLMRARRRRLIGLDRRGRDGRDIED